MLDVAWLLQFAATHPNNNQHASNTFDCMYVPMDEIQKMARVAQTQIVAICHNAVLSSQSVPLQFVTRAIVNVQRAVSQALFETYRDIVTPSQAALFEDEDEEEDE